MSAWSRIANVLRRTRVDRDIDEELQSHFEDAQAAGRDPAEASRAFGSRLRTREAIHDAIVACWLESLVADAIFGCRQLFKHKTASAAAIVSLALGIGSCTAAFRLIDALLLRPLPVADPGRLYVLSYEALRARDGQTDIDDSFDYPGFRRLRDSVKNHAELMALSYGIGRMDITFGSDADMEKVHWQFVSGWTFSEFGLKPALGRLLTEADDVTPGAHPYVVISYDYWSRRFGRDPVVIGRTFRRGNDLYRIVGVAPEGFTGTETGTLTDVFAPTMMNAPAISRADMNWFRIWARLKPGVDRESARQELAAAVHAIRLEKAKGFPSTAPKRFVEQFVSAPVMLQPAAAGISNLQKTYRRALSILAVLVALVLLIACANVANLMTAQAASRAREMALRVSIGAGRARLIQLVLVESALIAACASAVGLLLAWRTAPLVVGMINPPDDPARLILPADWRVTVFAVAMTFAVTILFGLAPALRASSVKPASALKGGHDPRSRRRLMNALIAVQVAFCVLVHFVAGLFISTFHRLENEPTGFSSARVLTLETVAPHEVPAALWYQTAQRLGSLSGVESAALSGWALMSGNVWSDYVWANGHSPEENAPAAWFLSISPGWLDTMRVPLLEGRDFHWDDEFPDVAMVNEAFARRYFEGRSPVGETFDIFRANKRVSIRIVGYVRDTRYSDMRSPIPETAYVPFRKRDGFSGPPTGSATFVVRTHTQNPALLASLLRHEIPQARPEFRVANIRTQEELVRARTIRERMLAMLSLFFAAVALVLAGVGLYGVLDYAVVERRRELGIRLALGANAGHIVWRVSVEVLAMLALGSAAGLALGLSSERYIAALLYQVKASDFSILAVPAGIIVAAALVAALPPVLRAIRIDAAEMLRAE